MLSDVRCFAVPSALICLVGLSIAAGADWLGNDRALPQRCTRDDGLPMLDYALVRVLPHDRNAYTEGLVIADGDLFESTGLYGESELLRVAVRTGEVQARQSLPAELFGEGLALADDQLIQLTWHEDVVRRYRPGDFALVAEQRLDTEGWGLTFDGRNLIQSDGSASLYFRDLKTLQEQRRVEVTAAGQPVTDINELEYVNGRLLANIFQTTCIAVIEPTDGQVTAWIDISELAQRARRKWRQAEVANGIAYDATTGTYYLTGKYWPELYEVRIDALNGP